MKTPKLNDDGIRHDSDTEEISRRAYALWERSGCTHGHSIADWLEAERQVHGTTVTAEELAPFDLTGRRPMPAERTNPMELGRMPAIEVPPEKSRR